MVVGIIVITVMLILATPFLFKLSAQYKMTEKSYDSLAALNLAEAGAERAIWEMNYGDISTWEGDSVLRSFTIFSFQAAGGAPVGDIEVNVINPEGNYPVVQSTGKIAQPGGQVLTKTARVILERKGDPLFSYGVFAGERVVLNAGVTVDGNVGTNGTSSIPGSEAIVLNNGAHIAGDAACGPGGDPETAIKLNGSASIAGTKKALAEAKNIPSVVEPEGLHFYPDGIAIAGGTVILDESVSGRYPSFSVEGSANVKVVGPVILCVETFSLGRETTLQTEQSGSLTVYINNSIAIDNTCYINNTQEDATRLVFYGTDNLVGDIEFACRTVFYGAIYMPRANIFLAKDFDIYGAVYANILILNRNVNVSYDEGLGSLAGTPGGALQGSHFSVKSWQEVRPQN